MKANDVMRKESASHRPSYTIHGSLKDMFFHRCQRNSATTGNAKNANVNLTKIPTEHVTPISRSVYAPLVLCRVFAFVETTTRRNANTIASKLFVNGLTPNVKHGHDDANTITSIGGPVYTLYDNVDAEPFLCLFLLFNMVNIQRDPSRNITDRIAMNNRGINKISFPDKSFVAGDHNIDDCMNGLCNSALISSPFVSVVSTPENSVIQ